MRETRRLRRVAFTVEVKMSAYKTYILENRAYDKQELQYIMA